MIGCFNCTIARSRGLLPLPYIPCTASSESTRLHLVAVTADGRRVYFTTSALRYGQYYGGSATPSAPTQVRGDLGEMSSEIRTFLGMI